ncbi:porin [Ferrimonas aestuarii]|uniref:Porin n=1 Tax=Ferrimonas aestuarii TaxID=2569539 RepID=A0A4U1BVQ7_9GAMM|nr:porin [Ferrimonas aestuarii]TKB58701.1 porin [Ferrimonas aestuarii]
MKKHVVASSILLALLSGTAMANDAVNFYGAMRMSVTDADTGFASNPGGGEGTTLENDMTMVGIKGAVELNSALNLIYQAEVLVQAEDDSNGSEPFKSRDTWLGLQGQFGSIKFGRIGQAFWKAEGGVDQFNLTNTDIGRIFSGNSRYGDSIMYQSPTIGGATFMASYQLEDDAKAKDYDKDWDKQGDLYSAAILFGDKKLKKSNYFLAAGYNAGMGGDEAFRITGQTKLGDLKIGAIFQDTQDLQYDNLDGNGFTVDLAYPITKNISLKARYAQDDSGNGKYAGNVIKSVSAAKGDITKAEVTNYAIGADYKLSKSAKMFAHYSRFDAEVATTETLYDDGDNIFTVGMHYKF